MNILLTLTGIILGSAISLAVVRINKHYKDKLEGKRQEMIEHAKKEAAQIIASIQERVDEIKKSAHEENTRIEEQLNMLKKTLEFKNGILMKREQRNALISESYNKSKIEIRKTKELITNMEKDIVEKLKTKTALDSESAKKIILGQFKEEADIKKTKVVQQTEEDAQEDSMAISKNMLKGVIQKLTSPSSVDKNSTDIKVKNDKFKGYLIGKGGSNIEYFESLLPDTEVIFNMDPDTIYVAGLNLVNRNIGKNAIVILQKEKGPLDHGKIKRAVDAAKKEMDKEVLKIGIEAAKKANLKIKVPDDLLKIVGRLKYRTSFGQNVLQHSIEMSAIAALLAAELKADIEKAKIAAFFHDIGKAIDHDIGGSHDQLSKEILEKYNFDPDVVHAAYAHHDAEPQKTPEAMLVKAADAISAGRPGARQESLTNYLERVQKLEEITRSFEGVKKSFAVSAGREIRVVVDEATIRDEDILQMAESVATKIEQDLAFPGKIKVNIIRRTEAIDYAK